VRAAEEPIEQRAQRPCRIDAGDVRGAFSRFGGNALYEKTRIPRFCLAGLRVQQRGNGLVFDRSPYKDLYIQAAAGRRRRRHRAAYWVWNEIPRQHQVLRMTHAYWGPEYDDMAIDESIAARHSDLNAAHCTIRAHRR